jgi:nucleoid DNA-binding protein
MTRKTYAKTKPTISTASASKKSSAEAAPPIITMAALAAALAGDHKFTRQQSSAMVTDFVERIVTYLKKGHSVKIGRLGTMKVEATKPSLPIVTMATLADAIAGDHKITRQQSSEMLSDFVGRIVGNLEKGARVKVGGLGTIQMGPEGIIRVADERPPAKEVDAGSIKNILHLTLHREPFAQIAAGTKRIEYRDRTAHWRRRLEGRTYDAIKFRNGYARNAPEMLVEYLGLRADSVKYAIQLGRILTIKNWRAP